MRFTCRTSRSVWIDLVTSIYFCGIGNVSSFGTKSWTRGPLWWRLMKSPWIDQKSARTSASSVVSVGWIYLGSPWSSLLKSSLLTVGSRLGAGSRNLLSLPDNFVHHLQMGTWIQQLFVWSVLVSRCFVEDKCLLHPTFPNLPGLLSKYLLSKFLPRSAHSQERFLEVLSCQIDEFFPDLSWSRMIFNHCSKRNYWPFEMVFLIVFHFAFSRRQGGVGRFADSNSIP